MSMKVLTNIKVCVCACVLSSAVFPLYGFLASKLCHHPSALYVAAVLSA